MQVSTQRWSLGRRGLLPRAAAPSHQPADDLEPVTERRDPRVDVRLRREMSRLDAADQLPLTVWLAGADEALRAQFRERLAADLAVAVDGELADPPMFMVRATRAQIEAILANADVLAISLYQIETE